MYNHFVVACSYYTSTVYVEPQNLYFENLLCAYICNKIVRSTISLVLKSTSEKLHYLSGTRVHSIFIIGYEPFFEIRENLV